MRYNYAPTKDGFRILRSYNVSTMKQIEANRLNARKSTGPRTDQGKSISAQNATKLGIFSREILLPDEDLAELQTLGRAIRTDLKPSGPIELALAEIVISALWRLRRILKIETALFEMYRRYKGVDGGPPVAFAHDASQMDCFWRVERMETTLERRLYKALAELARVQSSRRANNDDAIEVDVVTTPQPPSPAAPTGLCDFNGNGRRSVCV